METIKRQLRIPPDHKLILELDLPKSMPVGDAEILVVISPLADEPETDAASLLALAGCLKDSPALSEDPLSLQRSWRDEWR